MTAAEKKAFQDGRTSGLREAAIVVNAIQDLLPKDHKSNGDFDYKGALFHPECRKIWYACRQAVIDLIPDDSPSVKQNGGATMKPAPLTPEQKERE